MRLTSSCAGFPFPENVKLAADLESLVRKYGAIPATIGVLNGVARVGMTPTELNELTASAGKEGTRKLSRRDLAYICGLVINYLAVTILYLIILCIADFILRDFQVKS